jgi:MazG family protein
MTGPPTPDFPAIARAQGAARAASEREAVARLIDLVGVIYRLRDPDGCPWDRAQSVDSMAQNLLEEAAETHEAIAAGGDAETCEELGDVLMNVLLIARIAEQDGFLDLAQVAAGIAEKLVRRHPHVFGDVKAADAQAALASWNAVKDQEQATKKQRRASALDGVPEALPALSAGARTIDKAAATGFDWPDARAAMAKLDEEAAELRDAVAAGSPARIEDELGDVLFAAVAVGRKVGLDPELALRRALAKFRRRFAALEAQLGPRLGRADLDELLAAWDRAVLAERAGGGTVELP